jgi:hypothetical protein
MVYANAKAPKNLQDLNRAREVTNFILNNMMARDEHGIYFLSAVDSNGKELSVGRHFTFSFEQSYPIAALLALYTADTKNNADLLPVIRAASQGYWNRFHDAEFGGLFYYYNFDKKNHSNDQGEIHKSYQSTIYPLSSFLFSLREADKKNKALYDQWIGDLLDISLKHIVEFSNDLPTGWLIERFSSDFKTDESYKMTEAGHITQLAWVLGVAVRNNIITIPTKRNQYLMISKLLLQKFIEHGGISPTGAVYDAFDRTTGKVWSDTNGNETSAWWSNMEAIIGYAFAKKAGLFNQNENLKIEEILNALTNSYFKYFVDSKEGGEYTRINANTGEVVDSNKGNPGKSGYHTTETYSYLFGTNGFAR